MKIKRFVFSPFQENTYVCWDETTKESVIIDPSCLTQNEEEELESFIIKNSLKVKYLFNTHGHLDHIFGNAFLTGKFSLTHYVPEKDIPLFEKGVEQAESFGIKMKSSPISDNYFDIIRCLKNKTLNAIKRHFIRNSL